MRSLRPGRRYAYRIVVKPHAVPPWAEPPEQAPSAPEVYETPATVPLPPKPMRCTRRERAAFEVLPLLPVHTLFTLSSSGHLAWTPAIFAHSHVLHSGTTLSPDISMSLMVVLLCCSCGGKSHLRREEGPSWNTQHRCGSLAGLTQTRRPQR